ncbi:hypothetical protein [Mycobacterium sp. IDR2000157661]|uniref:hypothetical protein n=1 Tax=Mycobacterium sp. IDR2000157661 TaxID=2867005 RepID=UPI001EEA3C07|nr:hypothetical protein [Mycobacterium sp. IDR2000157661]ULE31636.1 hypothetical protein K3G64_15655 [Mycobacterium sp. IDR2000157661]
MVRLFGISLVFLLSGCGLFSGQADSPDFANSSAIQRALGASGLMCHSYQPVRGEDLEPGMESAVDVGECEIDDETPRLVVWTDNDQKDDWADTSRQIGCAMSEGSGDSAFDYVAGERWSISDASQKLANKIADAIGGEVVHVECEQG